MTDVVQKATISGVSVTATRTDTGAEKKATTDDQGMYVVSGLQPGTYEIQLRKTGFQTLVRSDIKLQAGDKMQLDFEMSLGATAQAVTVTAEKKIEIQQDVPVPVTVVDAEELVSKGQVLLQDYLNATPGVSLVGGILNEQNIVIRGVGAIGGIAPTVGVTVDDVPFGGSTADTADLNIPDFDPGNLERIEVLRGPQGTLYGANSEGGLVKFVTRDPSPDAFSGRIESGFSNVYNGAQTGYNLRASFNVPITSDFAVRVSGFERQDPGYINNVVTNQRGVNEAQADGAQVSALWRPTERFSLKLSGLYQHNSGSSSNDSDIGAGLGAYQQNYAPGANAYRLTAQLYTATLKIDLGRVQLTSITGYSENAVHVSRDYSYAVGSKVHSLFGVSSADTPIGEDVHRETQELRLTGSLWHNLDWMIAGYYSHESGPYYEEVDAINSLTGKEAGVYLAEGIGTNGKIAPDVYGEYAGFADLTYHLTDNFDIQFGGRESHTGIQLNSYYQTGPDVGNTPVLQPFESSSSNAFTYLVAPRFKVSSDLMFYARVASGFRPGGPNYRSVLGKQDPQSFGPDKTTNYEIGAKGDFLSHLISVDASLYYIDFRKIQINVKDPVTAFAYTTNGAGARSTGVELSLTAHPSKSLALSGWMAYDDAALTQQFPTTSTLFGTRGNVLPYSEKWSGVVSANQKFPLWNKVTGFVGAEATFVGNRLGAFQATAARQDYPAYTKADLQVGAQYGSWTANIYANNVGNSHGLLAGGLGYSPPYAFEYITPRTVGVSFVRTFGPRNR